MRIEESATPQTSQTALPEESRFESITALRFLVLLAGIVGLTIAAVRASVLRTARSRFAPPSAQEARAMLGVFSRTWFVFGLLAGIPFLFEGLFSWPPAARDGRGPLNWFDAISRALALLVLATLWSRHLVARPRLSFHPRVFGDWLLSLQILALALFGDLALGQLIPSGFGTVNIASYCPGTEWLRVGLDEGVTAPTLEELMFRCLLYSALRAWCAPSLAVVLSSLGFGLAHSGSSFDIASATWFGFITTLAFQRSGTLGPLIVAHALYNMLAALSALVAHS